MQKKVASEEHKEIFARMEKIVTQEDKYISSLGKDNFLQQKSDLIQLESETRKAVQMWNKKIEEVQQEISKKQ